MFPYIAAYDPDTNKDIEYVDKDKDFTFPLNTKYRLKFDCMSSDKKGGFSWCPVKLGYDNNKYGLYLAADSKEKIFEGHWKSMKLIDPTTRQPNKTYMMTKKKGYCSPPQSHQTLKEGICMDDGLPEITIENYNAHNCGTNMTPSKGGYTRPQLCKFAINHLNKSRFKEFLASYLF